MSPALIEAIHRVLGDPSVLAVVAIAALFGVFIGSTPGLTATMAVALLVPVTYWLDPVTSLAAIVTMTACAIFAGDIPTTLLRIPGTPASAAYADDAYRFTRRGAPQIPLGACLVFSIVGGLIGAAALMLLGHQLAILAEWFSAAEYFWLYLLGLSCAVVVSSGSTLRAAVGLFVGLLLSTVGLSAVHPQARFTFGQPELLQGVNFIAAMIGLFGVSEVLHNLVRWQRDRLTRRAAVEFTATPAAAEDVVAAAPVGIGGMLAWPSKLAIRRPGALARSAGIGTLIGMLPGAGADIASFVSLAVSRRWSRQGAPEDERCLAGIADATTANSASLAGGWIPMLVFGIPGDSVTAIVMGVLLMKNITPGPEIFEKQAAVVYSIYLLFILANLVLLPVGLLAIQLGRFVVRAPRNVLLPAILLFCVIGAYAINSSYFDVGVMLAAGLLGFTFERRGIPLAPIVLGIILGGPLEERFVQTMVAADGNLLAFVDRRPAAVLAVCCLAVWLYAVYTAVRKPQQR